MHAYLTLHTFMSCHSLVTVLLGMAHPCWACRVPSPDPLDMLQASMGGLHVSSGRPEALQQQLEGNAHTAIVLEIVGMVWGGRDERGGGGGGGGRGV